MRATAPRRRARRCPDRGRRSSRSCAKRGCEPLEIPAPDVFWHRRQDVVPDRREAADELRNPGRAGQEPPVQVLAPVAPAADVHAADVAERADLALDATEQDADLGGKLVG